MKHCFRCGKIYTTKSNLNKHLKFAKLCDTIYLNLPRETIIKEYNKYLDTYIEYKTKVDENHENSDDNLGQNKSNNLAYICSYCQKVYTKKNSYNVHINKYCKTKKKIDKAKLMDEFLNTKYNLLKIEYEEKLEKQAEKIEEKLEKEIEDKNKLKKDLEEKIKELESKLVLTSQINNGQIGDNIINGDINNITIINNFGEEKFEMNAKECEKIMSYEFDMITKLIEYVHIIPPENRNSFIPSLKEKYAMILRDQKWDLVDRKEFIDNLVVTKNIMLEKMLDEYGSQFENVSPDRSRSIINFCKNDEEEYKRIRTGANLLLFNNKDMIRNTYEDKYNKKIQAR